MTIADFILNKLILDSTVPIRVLIRLRRTGKWASPVDNTHCVCGLLQDHIEYWHTTWVCVQAPYDADTWHLLVNFSECIPVVRYDSDVYELKVFMKHIPSVH